MSSGQANSSWHPAMMPNSASDIKKLPQPAPSHAPDESIAKESIAVSCLEDHPEEALDKSVGPDAWFPEYEVGGDTRLEEVAAGETSQQTPAPQEATAQEQPQPIAQESAEVSEEGLVEEPAQVAAEEPAQVAAEEPAPVAAEEPAEESAEEPAQEVPLEEPVEEQAGHAAGPAAEQPAQDQESTEESPDAEQPAASENASRHLSTPSFARTVSHEFNWNDDEDADWSLDKTNADPFKDMPANDRTNSFPAVPAAEHHETHSQEAHPVKHPLPSTLAENIVNELERQDDVEAKLASAFGGTDDGLLDDGDVDGSRHQQYIGGDVQGLDEEASDARFVEGLPLVQRDADAEVNGLAEDQPAANDDDDFFGQVRGAEPAETEDSEQPAPAQLGRKSTMQVLDAMDLGLSKPVTETLEEAPEEDELLEDSPDVQDDSAEQKPGEDLDAKWKEVFAEDDDEDFLLEDAAESNEIDPSAFLVDDDEGFLEDTDDLPAAPPVPASAVGAAAADRYLPQGQKTGSPSQQTNPYLPSAQPLGVQPPVPSAVAPSLASPLGYGMQPPRPEATKAQSFVDKAKGGYQSPYDLPMEVVKPKKRVSTQNLQRASTMQPPPPPQAHGTPPVGVPALPRSASMYAQAPPTPVMAAGGPVTPVTSSPAGQPPSGTPRPALPQSKGSFFEDLPVVAKVRPASRHTPSQPSPFGPPLGSQPPQHQMAPPPPAQYMPPQAAPRQPSSELPNLVAPERVSPYAAVQSNSMPVPSMPPAASTRYSPAPPSGSHLNGGVVPSALPSRYSPAPPASRPTSSGYSAPPVGPSPPVLPHLPRTSSPLAHFEVSARTGAGSHLEGGHVDRRGSSTYEQRVQRVPSLPPTREDDEEDGPTQFPVAGRSPLSPPQVALPLRQNSLPYSALQTPQTSSLSPHGSLATSPPKRAASTQNLSHLALSQNFVPPPRSQTQSPGALYGNRTVSKAAEYIPRPASVTGPASPPTAAPTIAPFQPASPPTTRPRGHSRNFNYIAPTDGREHDPLQRWKGAPIISWGVGGTIVTTFPKDIPRYGMGSPIPMIVRSPGEVRVQSIKDIQPLGERLAKFPGPLKGKSKKKETLAWLSSGIEALEANLPKNSSLQHHQSHDDKRAVERILLWKILRLFIEHDGVLEGNPTVEQAVRATLSPKPGDQLSSPLLTTGSSLASLAPASGAIQMNSDAVDPSSIEELRKYLLEGQRDKAVWAAADKRLWGHAMLIANTVSQDLYKQVTQEFVKKEVNYPGHNNESLATLYAVLSGNHEECVDELVPAHARAGLQLLAKDSGRGASKDVAEGLDKWQETLSLVLSNRSVDDTRAINSLGNLLSSYGRAEAAHVCFVFARNNAVFGGLDDPNSNFVLVGSDHKRQVDQFAKEAEPLLLSEVYEYGLSLAGGSNVPASSAHLAAYKYQHALTLAEYGFKDSALQYCEAIHHSITSQTRRSPYHHAMLEAAVEDLSKRLKLAPKEGSNSWIPKPSMNKVSDSVWNRFNKFVAGDDNEASGQGSPPGGVESGPFARIAGGTPNISRPPSASGMDQFGGGIPGYPMPMPMSNGPVAPVVPPPATRAGSRYAPGAASQPAPSAGNPYDPSSAYAPRSSMERTSSELNRGSFEMGRRSMEMSRPSMEMSRPSMEASRPSMEMSRPSLEVQNSYSSPNPYAPSLGTSPAQSFQGYNGTGLGLSQESSYAPVSQSEHVPTPQLPPSAPPAFGYEPYGKAEPEPNASPYSPTGPTAAVAEVSRPELTAFQPTSYGFVPPSLTPDESFKSEATENQEETNGGYEAPSYQPYGYEPPSYEQPQQDDDSDEESKPKTKKKGPMYDEDDDLVVAKTRDKSKEEKDRENAEMFRKVAEEEEKRAAEAKQQTKKGWGLGSWFGGKKEQPAAQDVAGGNNPNKPIRAKLGEKNSFFYDPDLKKWVNKNAKPEEGAGGPGKSTPPPPRSLSNGVPRSAASTPPPPGGSMSPNPDAGRASAPPGGPPSRVSSGASPTPGGGPPFASASASASLLPPGGSTPMMRSASNTSAMSTGSAGGPPSRPTTSMSNASSIDDLLGSMGPRAKGAARKGRKGGRYVDVMAKPAAA